MKKGTAKSTRPKVEPHKFRTELVVWPLELPWPSEGNEAAEKFYQSIEKQYAEEIAKAASNPDYVPIHRILLLPPEGGVPPSTVPSPGESPAIEAFCKVLADIIARILSQNLQSPDDPASNLVVETDN